MADNKSTATDTTAVSVVSLLKEISYMEQNPASRAVTGTFWQATQPVSIAGTVTVDLGANNDVTLATLPDTAASDLAHIHSNSDTIVTSLGNLDNSVDGNYLNVNLNIAGTDVSANAGVLTAQTLRVTIATDDEVNNSLASIDGKITACNTGAVVVSSGTITTITNAVAVTNADITSCKTALELLDNSVDGNYLNTNMNIAGTDVVGGAGAVAAGVQRVTLASDDPAVVSLGTLDNAISGSEMQVDVVAALPAGTNAIGKLAANTGVDIGDVDVTSIIPGVGATNLGKAIDTALGGTDTGVLALAVRDDTLNIRSGAENDCEPLHTDATGALWTDPQGNVAHDAADAGNPIKIGGKAITALSGATMVAANDRTDLYADEDGVLVTKNWTTNNDILMERVSNTDGASTASTVFGATASAYNMISTIVVHNAHATTNGYVDIRDGTAGTVLMTIPLPANGGAVINLPVPLRTSVNTALAFDVSASISTIYLSFIGYKSKA